MLSRLSARLSYANVVATVALFVALGGGAYAAVALPRNSVKAKQIAKNAVRASEIKSGAVRSSEVRNGSLLAGDFATGQLPKGDKGDKGEPGAAGPAGATNVRVRRADASVAAGATRLLPAACQAGERATGGGGSNGGEAGVNIIQSSPYPEVSAGTTPTGWQVTYHNTTGADSDIWAYAVCAAP
jgi:hypothetical protein